MTGTYPQHTRFHLLEATSQESVVLKVYYNRPSRLDVYVGDQYYPALNAYTGDSGTLLYHPAGPQYQPDVTTGNIGDNYYDPVTQLLYLLLRGPDPVDIVVSSVVQISFSLPPMTVDEFFGENIVSNLAVFLGIDPSNIIVVDITSESSRRKRGTASNLRFKRQSEGVTVDLIVSTPPEDQFDVETQETNRVILQQSTSAIVHAFQTGTLGDQLNLTIISKCNVCYYTEVLANY